MDFSRNSVHIRKKKLVNGNCSLYLDIYGNGVRVYEFLKLYLVPETGRKSRMQNKETMRIAENERIRKLAELSENPLRSDKKHANICSYTRKCMSEKSEGTASVYASVLRQIESFFGKDFYMEDLDEDKIRGFFAFMATSKNKNNPSRTLSKSTQHLYCTVFNTILRHAADDGIIPYDISKRIKIVQKDDNERQYLTMEEIQLLANTRLKKTYRRAFLFGCFTGMRESDIERMRWGDVSEHDGFTRITFRQKKTRSIEYLDISPQARKMMGERMSSECKVFPKFHCTNETNKTIRRWVKSVGIYKYITFHCSRHTFAVMMMTLGTDIYTTSKLLGHKNLETTQIYAKIVDKKKQEAVTKIPIII